MYVNMHEINRVCVRERQRSRQNEKDKERELQILGARVTSVK